MNCEWIETGPPYRCLRCDQTANSRRTRKSCKAGQRSVIVSERVVTMPPTADQKVSAIGGEAVEAWGLIRQVASLAAETHRWILAGCPLRSVDEQLAIEAICRECPKRRESDEGVSCGICGCQVTSKTPDEHTLKIRMGTTHCPDRPARW